MRIEIQYTIISVIYQKQFWRKFYTNRGKPQETMTISNTYLSLDLKELEE